MSHARGFSKALLLLLFLLTGTTLWAGPPFQTDDPEPVDVGHFEFYQFSSLSSTPVETDPTGPAFEFNWGAVSNLQLHIIVPFGAVIPSNNPIYLPGGVGKTAYGLTDTETGAKIRLVQESKHRPQIGIYPMFELPTGSYSRGLGVGKVWYKMPVWVQKSWGDWTTYSGAGYQIVPQTLYRNFFYTGWLLQRNIGKRWTLGGEAFSHRKEGFATPQTQASTLVDLGGIYYFKNPGLQLLFAYGHSVAGQTENYAYLGLYQTWGGKGGKGDKGFLARMFSGQGRE
ncbi:MAG: transporter [Candidatus Korobacteraceae bacterium]